MKTGLRVLLLVGMVIAQSAVAGEEPTEESVACDIGPVLKVYGGNEWNIYSCTAPDQLVVVSAPGNPAMPFYFVLYMKDGERRLSGEGNGSKEASAAAYEELRIIADSGEVIAALIAETKKHTTMKSDFLINHRPVLAVTSQPGNSGYNFCY